MSTAIALGRIMIPDSMNKKNDISHDFNKEFGEVISSEEDESLGLSISIRRGKFRTENFIASTNGLSRLCHENEIGKNFEFISEARSAEAARDVAILMLKISRLLIYRSITPPKRGEYILKESSRTTNQTIGVYFSNPVFCTEDFIKTISRSGIILVGLFPMTERDVSIARQGGWQALEDAWDENASDLQGIW